MYYHSRPLKHVQYGKIYPPSLDQTRAGFSAYYTWLGHYCGYCPQIWLSRSRNRITRYTKPEAREEETVLFGFEHIKGFPVSYDIWNNLLYHIPETQNTTMEETNQKMFASLQKFMGYVCKDKEPSEPSEQWYLRTFGKETLEEILEQDLFVEVDQVVVPSLNLKTAKQIFVRNERARKRLRQMGFIKDRIRILPTRIPDK